MKIVDIAEINVTSGAGGNGSIAFRREKHVPNGALRAVTGAAAVRSL